ncbi:hypothetical protein V5P93_003967 [Actinokineospora auranticolor]|uniref:Uncharacterized protein n=1 Tax=Actinokineospora auranticolor TaxID=155976 RepID=A0A2S6GM44_9PSEU|nr:hypothetical protein [Actinokineospora auranticolor]PPK66250.1 hypothetical protein CLV40_111214 [Actinokineospora auranticolor]
MTTSTVVCDHCGHTNRLPAAAPALLVPRGGEVLARQAGAAPVTVLRGLLDRTLTSSQDFTKEVRT